MKRKNFINRTGTVLLGMLLPMGFSSSKNRSTIPVTGTAGSNAPNPGRLKLFLSGDVMTGRGIDQILPHSVSPGLKERYVKDARRYLELAENKSGDIPGEAS